MRAGDIVMAVNDESTTDVNHAAVVALLASGSPCSITFRTERSFYKLHSLAAKVLYRIWPRPCGCTCILSHHTEAHRGLVSNYHVHR